MLGRTIGNRYMFGIDALLDKMEINSMCLILAWNIGFVARYVAQIVLLHRVGVLGVEIFIS